MEERELPEVFFEIYSPALPRLGPGSAAATRRAYSMLPDLGLAPRILDLGCGSGAQTLDLARCSEGTIVAVDNHPAFVDELGRRAERAGLGDRIEARVGDMGALELPEESFDLIWSEGAIYNVGFEGGLRSWKPLLRPGGCLAVSELTWLQSDPPESCQSYWGGAYPPLTDVEHNRATIAECGYEELGHFPLPETCWLDEYYAPLERMLPELERKHRADPVALEVIAESRKEIATYRETSAWCGYVFFVTRKPG